MEDLQLAAEQHELFLRRTPALSEGLPLPNQRPVHVVDDNGDWSTPTALGCFDQNALAQLPSSAIRAHVSASRVAFHPSSRPCPHHW